MNPYSENLVSLAEAYAAHRGVSLWRVGALAVNRGSFFVRLKQGKLNCRTDTYLRALRWLSDNWPEPPEWPSDIPRPEPTHQLDEAA